MLALLFRPELVVGETVTELGLLTSMAMMFLYPPRNAGQKLALTYQIPGSHSYRNDICSAANGASPTGSWLIEHEVPRNRTNGQPTRVLLKSTAIKRKNGGSGRLKMVTQHKVTIPCLIC